MQLLYKWFNTGKVADLSGQEIQGVEIGVAIRHTLVRKMFTSVHIEKDVKKECFAKLA